jgi:hypothetical protein
MRRTILISSLFLAATFLTSSSAQAQQSTTATAAFSPAPSGHGRGIGVGAMTMLNGTDGALVTWGSPGGGFHVDGFFGLEHYSGGGGSTPFSLGGRFWYHIHAAAFADFSLGGGVGIHHWKDTNSHNDVSLEVGSQMRAFLVPNVALLADLGLGITFADNDNILIGAQSVGGSNFVQGTLGIAYFFE